MIDRAIDTLDTFAERYRTPISVFSIAWMVMGWASSARFIALPVFLKIDGTVGLILGIVFNALWWGFGYPRVQRRRKARELSQKAENGQLTNG